MSRFEHAFHLAIGPQQVAADALSALHAALIARTPELAPGDPLRLGLLAAERDDLAGQVLALEYQADPTENIDMSIGWLLLAAHAGDEDPHVATLAACRLADRIERRFDRSPPREIRRNQVLQAADDWRCWSGGADFAPIPRNPARDHGLAA